MFVILNPSPVVTLTLSEPEGWGLAFCLRANSVKNLIESKSLKPEILRPMPQNDIATHPLGEESGVRGKSYFLLFSLNTTCFGHFCNF
jgi:hypothetical protein